MSYYDDDEYDPDLSDDYEDDYEDEDEDDDSSSSSRGGSSNRPFSSGGLPGQNRFGSGNAPAGGLNRNLPGSRPGFSSPSSRDDDRPSNPASRPSSSGGSQQGNSPRPFGGGTSSNNPSGGTGIGGQRPGSPSTSSRDDKPDDRSESGSRFGGGSQQGNSPRPFGGGTSSNNPSGGTGIGGQRPGSPGTPSRDDKPDESGSRFGGGSQQGNAPRTFGSGTSSNNPSGGTGIGGQRPGSPSTPARDDKPDDKKDDKPSSPLGGIASGLGGVTSRFGLGGKKDDDKKDEKKDEKPSSPLGGITSGLGGVTSRLGIGGKKEDDKPSDKKDDKPGDGKPSSPLGGITSGLGGVTSRLGIGGKKEDDKPGDAKPASPLGGIAAGIGGVTSRFGFGGKKEEDKPAESTPAGAKPSTPGTGSAPTSTAPGARPGTTTPAGSSTIGASRFPGSSGSTPATGEKPATPKAQNATAATPATEPTEGLFGRIRQRLPFGLASEEDKKSAAAAPKTSKTRASKVPEPVAEGLSLDQKLDILGVALVFSAFVLIFSTLSPQQGAIPGAINGILTELFGWGALAIPMTMFAAGGWLIVRHFGETAPKIDTLRLIGVFMAFVGLLIIFQYIESFKPIYRGANVEQLNIVFQIGIDQGRGGGKLGVMLYIFLFENVGEIGGAVVVFGWMVVSIMFMTRTSAAELAAITYSVYRSFQIALEHRAQRREAMRIEAEERRAAELAAQAQSQTQISVSRPMPPELPSSNPIPIAPALPLPTMEPEPARIEERSIPIRMGGQMITTQVGAETSAPPPTLPQQAPKPAAAQSEEPSGSRIGGFASKLRGGLPWAGKPGESEEKQEKPPEESRLRSMFGRPSESKPAEQPATSTPTPAAPTTQPTAVTPTPTPASTPPVTPTVPQQPAASAAPPTSAPTEQSPFARPAETEKPAATVAPVTASPEDTVETMEPARPKGIGIAPRPETASRFGTGPLGQPKPAETTPEPETAKPLTAERLDRLNELRSGMTARPAATEQPAPQTPAATTTPSTPEVSTDAAASRIRPFTPTTPAKPDGNTEEKPAVVTPAASVPSTPAAVPSAPTSTPASTEAARPGISLPKEPSPVNPPQRGRRNWTIPDYKSVLTSGSEQDFDRETLVKRARIIEDTLNSFGAPGRVVEINTGPVITQFGVEPDYLMARGGKKSRVKVSAIAQLDKDLQLALNAKSIRIEAPVPGKGFVGVEVPNDESVTVNLRDVMESKEFQRIKSPLAIALGQSVDGTPVAADLASMPHLLIAGTTGSGKSVCVNAIIASLLLRNTPDKLKLIMVDPKRVELTGYNGIPHLVAPVVVELERIVGVLKWVTREMDDRYKKFSIAGARNIEDYNKHLSQNEENMPYIVVIIDELADLMMLAPDETERVITRIAALARATGIHLVIATQRPSVDVVTGLIKANFPARIAFAVASGVDSRVILDQPGAERLLGRGDMLYMSGDSPAPQRLQGVYVSDTEINNMTRHWRTQGLDGGEQRPITALVMDSTPSAASEARSVAPRPVAMPAASPQRAFWDDEDEDDETGVNGRDDDDDMDENQEDEMYEEAVELVRRLNKASVSLLQRRLRIGYTRAARLIDLMEERGVVGPATEGSKPRDVLPEPKRK